MIGRLAAPDALLEMHILHTINGDTEEVSFAEDTVTAAIATTLQTDALAAPAEIRRCTALLQAVDALVQPSVIAASDNLEGADRSAARLPADTRDLLAKIADLTTTARGLRARRRQALVSAFDMLQDSGDLRTFAQTTLYPLLCRPWLPHLVYEPGMPPPEQVETLWDERAADILEGAIEQADRGMDGLGTLLNQLDRVPPARCPLARDTVAFVRTALVAWRTEQTRLPIAAPVLIVPADPAWPLGHLLDVLIVPTGVSEHQSIRDAGVLTSQSLHPAIRAAALFLRDDPAAETALVSIGTEVVVGDYPGGGRPIGPVHGPSAGLALAAAILERVCGLAWAQSTAATAGITEEGLVAPLEDSHGLRCKGRAASLTDYATVVVAGNADDLDVGDGGWLRQGAESVGHAISVQPIRKLAEIAGTLLRDPYADHLARIAVIPDDTPSVAAAAAIELWAGVIKHRAADDRFVLALPWAPFSGKDGTPSGHVQTAHALAGLLARAAKAISQAGRTIPVVLDTRTLAPVLGNQAIPSSLLDALTEQLSSNDEEGQDNTRLRPLVRAHLRSGELLPIIAGLADVDGYGGYLGEADATRLIEEFEALHARRVVLVARGSGGRDTKPFVARHELLRSHGFSAAWLLTPDTSFPHPLRRHQEDMLADPGGEAFSQLLPLQVVARELDTDEQHQEERRLAIAQRFFLPDIPGSVADAATSQEPGIIPRLARTFQTAGVADLHPGDDTWDEAELHDFLTGPRGGGVILLDGEDHEGGTGKSTVLLSLLADTYRQGRPALYVPLRAVRSWRRADDFLAAMLRHCELDRDPAVRDQLTSHAQGLLLILDGLNEVVDLPPDYATQAIDGLAAALCGGIRGTRVVVASRADEWLTEPRAMQERVEDLPPPAQFRHALLARDANHLPLMLRTRSLAPAAAEDYLRQSPQGPEVLDALGIDRAALITHAFTLGLLAISGTHAGAPDRLYERRVQQNKLYQWDVVDIVVDDLIEYGLRPERREKRGTLRRPLVDRAYARKLLEHLAFTMAKQNGDLDSDSARGVVDAAEAAHRRMIAERMVAALGTHAENAPNADAIQTLSETIAGLHAEERLGDGADAARILDELCAVSLVLLSDAFLRYWLVHELLRDVLSSTMLLRQREQAEMVAYYRDQIRDARDNPALRATVRTALLRECQEGNVALIEALCQTDPNRDDVRHLLVRVLQEHARDNREWVVARLRGLLPVDTAHPRPGQLNAGRIATEVAGSIGMVDLLATAMHSRSDPISAEGQRHTFYLWKRDPDAALNVLHLLLPHVTRARFVPDIPLLQRCAILSLLMFADALQPAVATRVPDARGRLQAFWHEALGKFPIRSRSPVARWTRTHLIEQGIRLVTIVLRGSQRYTTAGVREMATVCDLRGEDRASFRRLVSSLDADVADLPSLKEEMRAAIVRNDLISLFVMDFVLIRQAKLRPQETFALVTELWDDAVRLRPSGQGEGHLGFALYNMQRCNGRFLPEAAPYYVARTDELLARSHGVCHGQTTDSVSIGFDAAIVYDFELRGVVAPCELVEKYLQIAITNRDSDFLIDALWYLRLLRFTPRYYRSLLVNLIPLLAYQDAVDEAVQRELIKLLAGLRANQPDTVDTFLAQQETISPAFRDQVISGSLDEEVITDLVVGGISYWLTDAFVYMLDDERLRRTVYIPALLEFTERGSMASWLSYAVKTVANLVYGEAVFDVS